jgi:hypothetical protein
MKDTNNKTDKNKEEHCYYSGLPSPMAYVTKESVEEVSEVDELNKKEQKNNKQQNK